MYCAKCGTELLEGAQFCSKCGTPINEQDSEYSNVNPNRANNLNQTRKKVMGIPIAIVSMIISVICILLSLAIFSTRGGHSVLYRPISIVTLVIMVILLIASILLRKMQFLTILPIIALVGMDTVTIQATLALCGIPNLEFIGGLFLYTYRIILPISAVVFVISVFVKGAAGKMCSGIAILGLSVSSIEVFLKSMEYTSVLPFRGWDTPGIPMYLRIVFYVCYVFISVGLLTSKD